MSVCKYFSEGRCKFGNRCRYEHIIDNRYQYNSRNQHVYEPQLPSKYDQYENKNKYQSYYGRDDYGYEESYGQHTQNMYTWTAPDSPYAHKPSKYDFSFKIPQNERGRSENKNIVQQFAFNNSTNISNFSFKIPQAEKSENKTTVQSPFTFSSSQKFNNSSNASGFSFKIPQTERSENKITTQRPFSFSSSQNFSNALDKSTVEAYHAESVVDIDSVKEDMIAWEEGEQWPFTCYFPFKGHPAFPDFNDMSPEELRYKAYEAEKNNSLPLYIKSVNDALNIVKQKRDLLKNPSPETIQIINKIGKEKLDFNNDVKQTTPSRSEFFSGMSSSRSEETPQVLFGKLTTEPSSGFKLNHLTNNNMQRLNKIEQTSMDSSDYANSSFRFTSLPKQSSDFSFKLAAEDIKLSSVKTPNKIKYYTPLAELTDDEKEAFNAPVFTLGNIPLRPPPRELCF